MTSLLKKIFYKQAPTEEELYTIWEDSDHTISEFTKFISNLNSEKKFEIISKELPNLNLRNLSEISELTNFLGTFNNELIRPFTENYKFILDIFKPMESSKNVNINWNFKEIVCMNKFTLFSFLLQYKHLSNLKDILYSSYFTQNGYLKLLQYFLLSSKFEVLEFILPNKNNIEIIQRNGCIKIKHEFGNIFNIQNISKNKNSLLEYFHNLLIELSNNRLPFMKNAFHIIKFINTKKEDVANNNLSIEYQEVYNNLSTLIQLFCLYKEVVTKFAIKKEKNYLSFINEDILNSFNLELISAISKSEKDYFINFFSQFFDLINNLGIKKNIRLILLQILLKERTPIQNLSMYIRIITKNKSHADDIQIIKNILIKFLIENYSDNLANNLIFLQNLELNENDLELTHHYTVLSHAIKILNIFNSKKINFNLQNFIKNEYEISEGKIKFEKSDFFNKLKEYLEIITNNLKSTGINFYDLNYDSISMIDDFLSKRFKISFTNDVMPNYLEGKLTLRVLNNNQKLKISESSVLEKLINKFISSRLELTHNELKDYISDIRNFLEENPNNIQKLKLNKVMRVIQIKRVFEDNQIGAEVLNEFDYEQLNLHFMSILEIFLISKFNLEAIDNLDNLIQRTDDIRKALGMENSYNNFLFLLFEIFFKYQKEDMYITILNSFTSQNKSDVHYFDMCLKIMKKSNLDFRNLKLNNQEKFDLKSKILENSEDMNMILNELTENYNQLNSEENASIKFNLEQVDNFTSLNLEKGKSDYLELIRRYKISSINNLLHNEDISTKNQRLKEKFLSFVQEFDKIGKLENKVSTKPNSMKYSLNPKLKISLESINFDYSGKEFKINTNYPFKIKIYRTLLKLKKINFEEILEIENSNFKNRKAEHADIIKIIKLVVLLLSSQNEGDSIILNSFKIVIKSCVNESQLELNKLIREVLTNLLHDFNYVSSSTLINLNNIFYDFETFTLLSDETVELINTYSLLNKVTREKCNILPFLPKQCFNKLVKEYDLLAQMNTTYNEYISNINYFSSFEKENINTLQLKYQFIEIYKNLNLNNFFNIHKFFILLKNEQNMNECALIDNIFPIFYIKLVIQLCNISSACSSFIPTIKTIIELFKKYKIEEEQLKKVILEILNMPVVCFINESHKSILLLDQNIGVVIRNFMASKLYVFQAIFSDPDFNLILNKNYLIIDTFKIFKMKSYIIQSLTGTDSEVSQSYENLQHFQEYHQIKNYVKKDSSLIKELEKIYTE